VSDERPVLKIVRGDGVVPPKTGAEVVQDIEVTVRELIQIIYTFRSWLMHSLTKCDCKTENLQAQLNIFKAIEVMGGDLTAIARVTALNVNMRLENVERPADQ